MTLCAPTSALDHLRAVDPVLARLIDASGPCMLQRDPHPFHVLTFSVVAQQISMRAAATIVGRISALVARGGPIEADGIRGSEVGILRDTGLTLAKARCILDVAELVADGQIDFARLAALDDEAVVAELVRVRGIGQWTADMFLIFGLGRYDVLSANDLGLRAAIRRQYALDELPNRADVLNLAARWAPYRAVAAWYLWRSLGNTSSDSATGSMWFSSLRSEAQR